MKESELTGYGRFYRSANGLDAGLGADPMLAFNRLMERPPNTIVPLSISHGVDFCHCYKPLDVDCREPIHWAYSQTIYDAAARIKPTVLLPHPWVLINGNRPVPRGKGTLVIGPPPGPENDKALYNLLLERHITGQTTVLVKPRGNYKPSIEYWKTMGMASICNDDSYSSSYSKLFDLLAGFDRIVSATFSSVLVYAAYMGKQISLLDGYSHKTYDVSGYREKVNFGSQQARNIVRAFYQDPMDSIIDLSRNLLGNHLPYDKLNTEEQYAAALQKVTSPIHFSSHPATPLQGIAIRFARLTGRAGFLALAKDGVRPFLGHRKVGIMRINELDVWLNGPNARNFSFRTVTHVKNVTIPGFAVSQYP